MKSNSTLHQNSTSIFFFFFFTTEVTKIFCFTSSEKSKICHVPLLLRCKKLSIYRVFVILVSLISGCQPKIIVDRVYWHLFWL